MEKALLKIEKRRRLSSRFVILGIVSIVVFFFIAIFIPELVVLFLLSVLSIAFGIKYFKRTEKLYKETVLNAYLNDLIEDGRFEPERKLDLDSSAKKKQIIKTKRKRHLVLVIA